MSSFFILLPHFTFHLFLLMLLTHFTSKSFSLCNSHETSALLQFKNLFFANTSSKPDDYCSSAPFKTESWKKNKDCCEWDGVTCDKVSDYVIGLDLSCNNLVGKLHPNSTIFQLRHLQHLNLAFNDFSMSQLHVGIGDLVNLTYLNLSHCNLTGNIPSTISHLSKLVSLDLSVNVMELNPFTWKKLIHNATNLRELNLDFVNLSSIRENYLSMLKFLSSSLVSLSLRHTELQGNLSSDILSLPNLQKLDLSHNEYLSGQLPKSNWSTPLRYLDLFDTAFSGEIPYSIGQLKSLTHLDLQACNFSGMVPPSLGNLTQLTLLNLAVNNLEGEIPSSLSKLTNLTYLGLSENKFSGKIPNIFEDLIKLEYLLLSSNKLVGPIPSEITKHSKLSIVDLGYNMLNGTIPHWCYYLPSLLTLDLRDNHLTGFISNFSTHSLKYLLLSNNKLQGDLPIPPYGIRYFLLSNNNFTGDIHSSFCNTSSLEMLNLAHNKLTGTIPRCMGTLPFLSIMDMQMNNLYGSIPTNFSKGNQFETIKLNDNQLEGPLPRSLAHCTKLETLDLGNNNIDDAFPMWLETLQELQVLSLRSNKLHGTITCTNNVRPFPKLRIFDISHNSFSGPLPTSLLKNFQGMMNMSNDKVGLEYLGKHRYYNDSVVVVMKGLFTELTRILTTFTTIDLSNNNFEGEIPHEIGELISLKGLNLSNNKITGNVPPSFSNLRNLEWLDLSRNQLRGEIPTTLTKLNFLTFLNLSQNHLEGIIPTGQQFDTFGNGSYEGNTMLCGFPLSKSCENDEDQRQHSTSEDEEESGFGWKAVVTGYVCGAISGLLFGYNVFFIGKPVCLVGFFERMFNVRLKRTRNRAGANRRRMN